MVVYESVFPKLLDVVEMIGLPVPPDITFRSQLVISLSMHEHPTFLGW